jgi:hypothetical protein
MSTTALGDLTQATPGRKQRAAKTVDSALRGGILAGAVAAIAWLMAVLAVIYTVVRGDKASLGIWALIAIAWALVLAEHWVVNKNGGIIVAGASWIGVVLGARRAGIAKKSLVLLLYPLISLAIVIGANTSVLDPWGVSWLWVLAILGPVVGARTMLNLSPRDHAPK